MKRREWRLVPIHDEHRPSVLASFGEPVDLIDRVVLFRAADGSEMLVLFGYWHVGTVREPDGTLRPAEELEVVAGLDALSEAGS